MITMENEIKHEIPQLLEKYKGINTEVYEIQSVGGGCINDAYKVITGSGNWFLKINEPEFEGMFECEQQGLELLRSTGEIFVPEPLGSGRFDNGKIFFLMEFVEEAPKEPDYWKNFGRQLARMHKYSNNKFGLDDDNFIGSLPQYNRFHETWTEFFINERIERQVRWAVENEIMDNTLASKIRDSYAEFEKIFPEEPPALLHGDLWGGNVMTGPEGQPCIIDPAVYYGHREVDLAFSQLFGSFPEDFYESYNKEWPLAPGFEKRKDVYNLYPALVHVNLFGGTYLSMVERFMETVEKAV